jgi:hypothetical protein
MNVLLFHSGQGNTKISNWNATRVCPAKRSKVWHVTQKSPHFIWNLKIHCRVHRTVPLDLISIRMNSVYIYYLKVNLLFCFHLRLAIPSEHIPFKLFNCNLMWMSHLLYPSHVTLYAPLIEGEECKLWSNSICNIPLPVSSSPLSPNILLGTLFWDICSRGSNT